MTFNIYHVTEDRPMPDIGVRPLDYWSWALVKGYEVIAQSPHSYETEALARQAVAKAKVVMRGARFARVEVKDTHIYNNVDPASP